MHNKEVWVVKDEEGSLRPQAGIWEDSFYAELSYKKYLKSNPTDTVVKVILTEIN